MTGAGPAGSAPPGDEQPGPPPSATGTPARTRLRAGIGALVLLVVVAAGVVAWRSGSGATVHAYDIPPGTRARIEAGEDVAIVPAELHVSAGDAFSVTNHDDVPHEVGLFTIRPGESLDYRFPNPGVFKGACTVHPSGGLTIYVS